MTEIKNSIFAGLAFAFLFGIFLALRYSVNTALILSPICGLFFGAGIYFFVTSKTVKEQTKINNEGQEIIYSGAANHFINGEAVGGKLYLLKDKLQFKSHNFNIQNHEFSIPITNINDIRFFNGFGFIPKGLEIITTTESSERFVVSNRKMWKEIILSVKT